MLHPRGKAWVRISCSFPSPLETAGKTSHPDLAHFPGPKSRADKGATEGGLEATISGLGVTPHPRPQPPWWQQPGGTEATAAVRAHSLTAGAMLRSLPLWPVPLRPLRPLLSPEPV